MSEHANHEPGRQAEHISLPAESVRLPEYLRKQTMESLLPGTVAYFYPGVLHFDQGADALILHTDHAVEDKNLSLESYIRSKRNNIAVMPVIDDQGETHYLVDATGLSNGGVEVKTDFLGYAEEREEGAPDRSSLARRKQYTPVSAAAFTNLDGDIELHGNSAYFDSLAYLVSSYDELIAANIASQNSGFPMPAITDPSLETTSDDEDLDDDDTEAMLRESDRMDEEMARIEQEEAEMQAQLDDLDDDQN